MKQQRICLWSGPRNVSTALMYAFAERPDTTAVDEPLYAHYLRVSGSRHPGWEDVLAGQENDGETVVREVMFGDYETSVVFLKQMAHHLVALDLSFLEQMTNVFLVRDPRQMLPSLIHQVPEPRLADTGLGMQWQLFSEMSARGEEPPVVDSKELLLDPPGVLRQLCERLGLEFDPGMLSWQPGRRDFDGVWAPHWYHNVHRSTGFQPFRAKSDPFPEFLEELYAECAPYYEKLRAVAVTADR